MQEQIRVAIVDDQEIICSGIEKMLAGVRGIQLDGIYSDGGLLLEGLKKTRPDVLLLDIQMPGKSGFELAQIISKQYPEIKILVLSNNDILPQVKKMLQQGCRGYLLKTTDQETLVTAIHTVYRGSEFLDPGLQKQFVEVMFQHAKAHRNIPILTRREKEVLELIVKELTNQEIADKLFLSLKTVENHRINLLHKFGVKNTAGLVRIAVELSLV